MVATAGQTGRGYDKQSMYHVTYGENVMSAKMLEVSLYQEWERYPVSQTDA